MPYDVQDVHYEEALGRSRPAYVSTLERALPAVSYRKHFKRLFDVTLVLASSVVVVPIVLVMAALVAMDGHKPFYTQPRIGRGNKRFKIVKIRTMVPNADRVLQEKLEHDPALKAEWDAAQKLKKDFRVTRIGKILRKTSLDELPQLWNVLTGSMSLVGPRPMMIDQQAIYPGRGYYRLRPGITGFWQISKRNNCDFRDRAVFDDAYDRSVSLGTDLTVLARTVRVVLRGTGY
ncbi:MAG: sugar transferase [Pseudomonadota bacterium]